MQNQIQNSLQDPDVVYTNTFGTVSGDNFTIHALDNRVINLDNNLRKVKLIKKRRYRKNLFFFVLSVVAAVVFYAGKDNRFIAIASGVISLLTMVASMLIVEYRFKFMVVRKYDFSEYRTDHRYSDDAQQLALLVNKKIRTNDRLSAL
ncbi:MAG: hypothetical protein CFE23_13895 [Flavobacterium sp. BFFFF1]|uniref:hypothetical protein n=1 Tax=Flavobacterium sp. BFFFF1 TaxID=2015557 RepID=UPI000BC81CF8|nr:hypothetical protein [Flavobacterium sp. BFFFF1]OYU79450.1 MAG: hypothetical protein CFE23_13895 [Flavobacterium sp. BFFFF1]